MKIRVILIILFNALVYQNFSQTADKPLVDFPTPNAASIGLFTQVPVSQFTGTPNIGIPLYDIEVGKIKVPISLSYHPGSVRVHSHPGWVGLGWTLLTGGTITRSVQGQMDEYKSKSVAPNPNVETGFYASFSKLSGTDTEWYSNARLQQYSNEYVWLSTPRYEAMPDEFNFSFLGYSGKFFMGHDGQWKVICDQQIKIEFDPTMGVGFLNESQLPTEILNKINYYGNYTAKSVWSDRYFNKFTLITPDGIRFEFGGLNATEYTVPYLNQPNAGPLPVTWFLTKITDATGEVINFNYERGEIITSMTSSYWYNTSTRDIQRGLFRAFDCSTSQGTQLLETNYDGVIMFPVYLKSITYSIGEVWFDRQPTTELRWPSDLRIDLDLDENSIERKTLPVYFKPVNIGPEFLAGYGLQRVWHKLYQVRIYDNRFTGTNSMVKSYAFEYTNDSQTRLKLLSLQETGINGIHDVVKPPYLFSYNSQTLPSYSQTKSNDHWDFYNGLDPADFWVGGGSVDARAQQFYTAREPDKTGDFMKAEVLEQIQYPTGGKVKFEYEPHSYSKVVDRENSSFPVLDLQSNKMAGGLRIKSIKHFSNNASLVPSLIKDYYYVNGYSKGANVSDLSSSGILGGNPKYYWKNYMGKDIEGVEFTYSIFSSGSVLPYGFNTSGNHVGYSEVTEISSSIDGNSNGYTKYKFSNFDVDIWGQAHPDQIGVSLDPNRSVYSPITINEQQRGKLVSEEVYNNSNLPVKITKYQYEVASGGFVRRVLQEPFDMFAGCPTAGAQTCYVTAFKTPIDRVNLIRKEITEYDAARNFTTTLTYEYNGANLLRRSTKNVSDGLISDTNITYPSDYTSNNNIQTQDWEAVGVSKLLQKNIIGTPLETVQKKNGKVVGSSFMGYKVFGSNVFPHKQWKLESALPLTTGATIGKTTGLDTDKFNSAGLYLDNGNYFFPRDEHYSNQPTVFSLYDTKGNILEAYNENDIVTSYLWSYKSTLPVAEIVGATYAEVSNAGINVTSLANDNLSDVTRLSMIATLRSNLPKARITGYTYSVFGITSQSDPTGRTTSYEYDKLGRLQLVKDHEGKVIQAYQYHYSGQN